MALSVHQPALNVGIGIRDVQQAGCHFSQANMMLNAFESSRWVRGAVLISIDA